jgi:hypothetical protein
MFAGLDGRLEMGREEFHCGGGGGVEFANDDSRGIAPPTSQTSENVRSAAASTAVDYKELDGCDGTVNYALQQEYMLLSTVFSAGNPL